MTKSNKTKRSRDRRARAIEQLVAGRPLGEIAKAVGISRKTLWQWRRDPSFQHAWDERSKAISLATQTRLAELAHVAMDRLTAILDGSRKDLKVRDELAAIRLLLERLPAIDEKPEAEPRHDPFDDKSPFELEYYSLFGHFPNANSHLRPQVTDPDFRQYALKQFESQLDDLIEIYEEPASAP